MLAMDQVPKENGVLCSGGDTRVIDCRSASGCSSCAVLKKAVPCVAVVAVWMVLAIPIVMFYVPQDGPAGGVATTSNSRGTCTTMVAIIYTGVCQAALQSLQSCVAGEQRGGGPVYVPASEKFNEIEEHAQQLINSLPFLQPSQECEDAVVPFLCLYMFKLCSSDVNGTLYQPSAQQCSEIRDETCANEWKTALTFLGSESLPDCSSLPDDQPLICPSNGTGSNSTADGGSNASNATAELQCSEDFYSDGTVCRPECGEWEEWPSLTVDTIDGFFILATIVDIIASALTIMISIAQYKKMLKFPTSLIVYQSCGLFAIGVVMLVGFIDRKTLFCSSKDLLSSFYHPTAFCTISGVVFSYVLDQLMIWWFFHCVMTFWAIKFPFHYRKYHDDKRMKYIHIAAVLLGLVLPAVSVGAVFATGEYIMTRFPPFACVASNEETVFYTSIVPVCVLLATGMSLLIAVLYEILKVIKNKDRTRIAQAKIMIILLYYVILGVSSFTTYTVTTRQFSPFLEELTAYFICEADGRGQPCDRSGFMEYNNPIPSAISYVITGFIPAVSLLYIAKFQWLKCTRTQCRK